VKLERDKTFSASVTSSHHHHRQQHGASFVKSAKPCRYGPLCTRADCRYQHGSSSTQPSETQRYT